MDRPLRVLTSLSLLLLTILNLFSPTPQDRSPALAAQPVAAQAQTGGAIRTAYLYSTDATTAQEIVDLLNAGDFDATAIQIAAPDFLIYLPLVMKITGGTPAALTTQSAAAVPDFSNYDLIVIGPDTGTGGNWSAEEGLLPAIQASDLPVVGLGKGGHAFFGELELDIGYPAGQAVAGETVQVADYGTSQAFYSSPNSVDIPNDETLTLYTSSQQGIALPLSGPLPDGVRIAALSGAPSQYPIVASGDQYLLWGFGGSTSDMTTTGQELFINALHFLLQDMVLPIKGANAIPSAGFDQDFLNELGAGSDPLYAYVQLDHIPSTEERTGLESRGVTLLDYLGGTFYAASFDPSFDPSEAFIQDLVRWIGATAPELKVDPELIPTGARAVASEITTVMVHFFDDVAKVDAEAILAKYTTEATYMYDGTWEVPRTTEIIQGLSQESAVQWIGFGPPPPQDLNDTARILTGSDTVQNPIIPTTGAPTYLGLSGDGIVIAHFEDEADGSHTDLNGRVDIGTGTTGASDSHATHVGGIMVGSGEDSTNFGGSDYQWRGHAPEASLVSEGYGSANADSYSDGILNFGSEVSNHSYVQTSSGYDSTAAGVDSIVRGNATDSNGDTVPPRLAVWAAANQGRAAQYGNEEGFYSIYSPAKNSLSVGSVDSSDGELSMFSSKGPTFDGRIKPDVMAPGANIRSTEVGGGYTSKSGTSMAAPATTGVIALMLEQYHETFGSGSMPLPATLKAILVNTADDLVHTASDGSDQNDPDLCRAEGPGDTPLDWTDPLDTDCWIPYGPGPDFATGYGAINAVNAVAAVRGQMFLEDSLSPSDTEDTFTIQVPAGLDELRFTLAWDDEPGSASASATTNRLVNDLDLRLIAPDATVNLPFTLDPLPANASLGGGGLDPIDQDDITDAYRGDDDRNNVEMVLVENPDPGTWTIQVDIEGGFPTGNPQSYAIAGDVRTLNILDPQTGDVAEAGDPANPNVILVVVEAESALNNATSTLADADVGDFSVEIEGTPATIVSGSPVGDQFWLNVLPAGGTYSAGSKYNLTVALTAFGDDTENNSVLFTEREVADRAVVVDTSGSMNDYDKMAAAQNAARLFIDQSLIGDRIAVVEFSNSASAPYGITEVSSDPSTPELDAAKSAVNALIPGGSTAIGQGLLEGQNQVTTAPADFSELDVLILLSDGMENVDPKYATPAVKGTIEPTDTIIHTVAVGPSSAGHHTLLETIADDNGGTPYHVTTAGTVMAAAGATSGIEPTFGTGVDAWPQALSNRLGDVYKQIAEEMLGESRLYQANDLSDPKAGVYTDTVQIPAGLKRVTFALNWEVPSHLLQLLITDPEGNEYTPDPQKPDRFCRDDATHQTCIIDAPVPGTWRMTVKFIETGRDNEYALWVSARTSVNFRLLVGTPAKERAAGDPILLLGYLDQFGKPLPGQKVAVKVYNGQGTLLATLQLMDDGQHGDGGEDDGIYGAYFLNGDEPGPYAVRGVADGTDHNDEPFLLFDNTNFHLKPRVLYVHDDDLETAWDYERLIESHGVAVDLARKGAVPLLNLQNYSLVIIGPETGNLKTWEPVDAVEAITRNEIPVLGLGEGGYAYFGKRGRDIGYPNGAHGNGTSIVRNTQTSTDDIWRYPYEFTPRKEAWQLYQEPSGRVDIYLGDQPTGLTIFGFNDTSDLYSDLTMENNWDMLWSFQDGPGTMTELGQQLFVNTVFRTMR